MSLKPVHRCLLLPPGATTGFRFYFSVNRLIHICQNSGDLIKISSQKRWTVGIKYLASLLMLLLRLPLFIHSDPKWFHDLQPAKNRATSQRVKTYCGPCSVLFHSHSFKLHLCIINTEHLCGELKFIEPVSCSAT